MGVLQICERLVGIIVGLCCTYRLCDPQSMELELPGRCPSLQDVVLVVNSD